MLTPKLTNQQNQNIMKTIRIFTSRRCVFSHHYVKPLLLSFLFCVMTMMGHADILFCGQWLTVSDTIEFEYLTGLAYYSAEDSTLTLENAHIDIPWPNDYHVDRVLYFSQGGHYKIKLIGDNSMTAVFPVWLWGSNCEISGPGRLTITSLNHAACCGFFFESDASSLFIQDNAEVTVYANNQWECGAGFRGEYYDWGDSTIAPPPYPIVDFVHRNDAKGNVTVRSATLRINADMGVYELSHFELENCHFSNPVDAYFDEECHTVVSSGQIVQGYLEVMPGEVNTPDNCQIHQRVCSREGAIFMENLAIGQVIEIYNTLGQQLASFKAPSSAMQVPMKPGTYIVRFQNHSRKVVVY